MAALTMQPKHKSAITEWTSKTFEDLHLRFKELWFIFQGNIGKDNLGNYAVTTEKLNDAAVTTGKIADDAVTMDKIGEAIPESALSITDNTTGNVTYQHHGFCPKTTSDLTKYLRDNATADWAVPDHTQLQNKGTNTHAQIDTHIANTSNPHSVTTTQIGAVPTSRNVNTSSGLSGGGALSSDLTLTPSYGSEANTICQGNDSRLSDTRTPTDNSVTTAKIVAAAVSSAWTGTGSGVSITSSSDTTVIVSGHVAASAGAAIYTRAKLIVDSTTIDSFGGVDASLATFTSDRIFFPLCGMTTVTSGTHHVYLTCAKDGGLGADYTALYGRVVVHVLYK